MWHELSSFLLAWAITALSLLARTKKRFARTNSCSPDKSFEKSLAEMLSEGLSQDESGEPGADARVSRAETFASDIGSTKKGGGVAR
jgi:hypothetical protein